MTKEKATALDRVSELRDETIYARQNLDDLINVVHKHNLQIYLSDVCDNQYKDYSLKHIQECRDALLELEDKANETMKEIYEQKSEASDRIPLKHSPTGEIA